MKHLGGALWLLASLGCAASPGDREASGPSNVAGAVRPGTPAAVDITRARASGRSQGFTWAPFEAESFARAAREGKLILIDGAASWCHWCHVMDETTYRDPEVGKILSEKFVAIRADIDAHPDVAERYGAWGWPATILLTPNAEEIGKFRGYLPPAELLRALEAAGAPPATDATGPDATPPAVEALPWVYARTLHDLDDFYDADEGGWGFRQKAPLGENVSFEVLRLTRGDATARARIEGALAGHAKLLDPVWGGIYQYSTGGTWKEPHYEKLMTFQAENLEGFAAGYRVTRQPGMLAGANAIAGYMRTFLSAPDGGFYTTQDADVNAHDTSAPFVDGHVFYQNDDRGRRALGMPRIDRSVYAYENGLAARAFVALFEATGDVAHRDRARDALARMKRTHLLPDGAVVHDDESKRTVRHLQDAAAVGLALLRLGDADPESRDLATATRIAEAALRAFDDGTGALFGHTEDPDAVGVFKVRRRPFEANVLAARFFLALGKSTGDGAWTDRAMRVTRAISTPSALTSRGRMLGGYLTLLLELGVPVGAGP